MPGTPAVHSPHRLRVRGPLAAMMCSLLVLLLAAGAEAAGTGHDRSAPEPTIVLVHGAWADGSSWGGVVPEQGESVVQLAGAQPGSALAVADPRTVFDLVPYPGAPPGDFDAYILPSVFRTAFANSLGATRAAVLASTQRPATLSALGTPSGSPAWTSIPSWALVGTLDRVLPPAEQQIMARRAGSHITRVKASHLSLVSRPGAVAAVILHAARAAH